MFFFVGLETPKEERKKAIWRFHRGMDGKIGAFYSVLVSTKKPWDVLICAYEILLYNWVCSISTANNQDFGHLSFK